MYNLPIVFFPEIVYTIDTKGKEVMTMKDIWTPIHCNYCDFKSQSAIKTIYHLIKVEKITPTKRDIKFLLKHCIPTKIILSLLGITCITIGIIIFIITYPFWKIHEILFN